MDIEEGLPAYGASSLVQVHSISPTSGTPGTIVTVRVEIPSIVSHGPNLSVQILFGESPSLRSCAKHVTTVFELLVKVPELEISSRRLVLKAQVLNGKDEVLDSVEIGTFDYVELARFPVSPQKHYVVGAGGRPGIRAPSATSPENEKLMWSGSLGGPNQIQDTRRRVIWQQVHPLSPPTKVHSDSSFVNMRAFGNVVTDFEKPTNIMPAWYKVSRFRRFGILIALLASTFLFLNLYDDRLSPRNSVVLPINAAEILSQCASLHLKPGPPSDFYERSESDRYVPGTPPTLLKNATVWIGDGETVISGDIFMEGGLIKSIGEVSKTLLNTPGLVTTDLEGSWVTPGIVDLHSHLGVYSAPALRGAADGNSINGPTQPWLRSLDGLNTHDDAYRLSISGGVTSALVLPGSANNIGGQAFMIKLRKTAEKSASAMVLEPPYNLWNGTRVDPSLPPRWRHTKHACGENPSRVYSSTRMDSIYRFRAIYGAAAALRDAQDAFCERAQAGDWNGLGAFPYDLQLEALVDTLRGKVKVNVHCYEAVDFDGIVRLTNEFQFPIAAFHHAHEAYLVPDLLKKTWGGAPAIAIFATNARYKREAYRGSEFAPKVLSENGIRVVMKSDHPVLDSRYLLYEAQQAHYYGLNSSLALASVTSTPAGAAGFDHRIGSIKQGYDADIVVWDSHPLRLGATPKQVWIDGIAQLSDPAIVPKPASLQEAPSTPNFNTESLDAVKFDGDVPLGPKKVVKDAVLVNVKDIWQRDASGRLTEYVHETYTDLSTVVVRDGAVICVGPSCVIPSVAEAEYIDLKGGCLAPGLTTFGSGLGLVEIRSESTTNDGVAYDYLSGGVPAVLGLNDAVTQAVDGLQFGGKDLLLAYRSGVTLAITSPRPAGFLSGLSTAFRTGAEMKTDDGAVVEPVTALHVSIGHYTQPSISAQIATLRKLVIDAQEGTAFEKVANGDIPLVINVDKADVMATLLDLKSEVEKKTGKKLKMTLANAVEAHMIAEEIAAAGVSVILAPSRPYPGLWDQRRTLPGPPLTEDTNLSVLLGHNVTVAIGVTEEWMARNTRFDAAWAYLEAYPKITKKQALALVSTNLEESLGVTSTMGHGDLVAYQGGDMFSTSKVVGVLSGQRGMVELF